MDVAIFVVGFDRSGKTEISRFLTAFGFQVMECGEIARAILGVGRGRELSLCYQARMTEVDDGICEAIQLAISSNPGARRLCVVGVRSENLYKKLYSKFIGESYWLFVECPMEVRYGRHLASMNEHLRLSPREFLLNDAMQESWGLLTIKPACDFLVVNDGSVEMLRQNVRRIMGVIL